MKRSLLIVFALVAVMFAFVACEEQKEASGKQETGKDVAEVKSAEMKEAPTPDAEGAAGFEEFDLGDEVDVGPLHIGGVYFQAVDMEPAGNSLSKNEADCHMEADISANEAGATLGYGVGDFIPYLRVRAIIKHVESGEEQEVAFMPMNASDGPHYGANVKFHKGLGKYNIRFEVSAPGNDYLLHVDEETGVTGRFWSEPLVAEYPDFEWTGPRW